MDIVEELKKDGLLLKTIPKKDQTTDICKIAIKQNPLALQFASRKCIDSTICLSAVKENGRVFRFIPKQIITEQMCILAIESEPELLNNIPEKFRTPQICIKALEKKVNVLSYVSQEQRYTLFNDKTEFALIERIVTYNPNWLIYMPNRSDVRKLCIDLMEKNFSIAQYMPQLVKESPSILNYQKRKGRIVYIDKYYNKDENTFCINIKVLYSNFIHESNENYLVAAKFYTFEEFYNFLDGKLDDAELREFDFDGIDLKKYNIVGAVINSSILSLQGLYNGDYYDTIKQNKENNENICVMKNELVLNKVIAYTKPVDDDGYAKIDYEQVPFFYVSDIHITHKVCKRFRDKGTKEEIRSYIKYLARKMVASIGTIPYGSYLLIAGDTSSRFEFLTIFYNELVLLWNPDKIIVIMGNHELWDPYIDMDENIEIYRRYFESIGIIFLQNALLYINNRMKSKIEEEQLLKLEIEDIREIVSHSSVTILGGIGFSGLNEKFNASNIKYGKSFDELSRKDALQKDITEAKRFNIIYTKILKAIPKNKVIVLTHAKKEDWNTDTHNKNWIYLNGHDHQNIFEISSEKTVYSDNQIGYRAKNIGLKYFYCDNCYDIFNYYQDGIYKITKEQYIEFSRGKMIQMSFKRDEGIIYMLKKHDSYMFLIYCEFNKRSRDKKLYLMNGGKLIGLRLNMLEDLTYYYDNMDKYIENVHQLLNRYTKGQTDLSSFVKKLGGSGKIHGCIVDIEKPNEWEGFSYCHLFINPTDGTVTPYYANDIKSRIIYKDFKTLLQDQDKCKLLLDNYLQIEKEIKTELPLVHYTGELKAWENENIKYLYDEGSYLYKISQIIKSLQYCTEKNIIRLWKEDLLNYDFVRRIINTNQIEELTDDRLIIDDAL